MVDDGSAAKAEIDLRQILDVVIEYLAPDSGVSPEDALARIGVIVHGWRKASMAARPHPEEPTPRQGKAGMALEQIVRLHDEWLSQSGSIPAREALSRMVDVVGPWRLDPQMGRRKGPGGDFYAVRTSVQESLDESERPPLNEKPGSRG